MKKFNLKKQLAFISSLALLAGTAMYMPANVGEILGTGKAISASADESSVTENEITDLGYYIGYYTNKNKSKEYKYNKETDAGAVTETVTDDNPYHVDITATSDTSFDVVFYIPDDMSASDTTFAFYIAFEYKETQYSFEKKISLSDDEIISGKKSTLNDNTATVNYAVKLVPSWDSMENVKNNEDIVFTDDKGIEHKSDRYTVKYEKDREKNSWVRVYTLKDEIPVVSMNRASLSTDKGICTNKYFDTERYSFDTNAVSNAEIYSDIPENEKISSELETVQGAYPPIYIKDGKLSADTDGTLIIEKLDNDNILFSNWYGTAYYAGNDGYLYGIDNGSGSKFTIKRVAKFTNSYVRVESVPVVNVTFNPNGGMFSDSTTDNKTVEVNKDEDYSIPDEYIPTRTGYTFKKWENTSGVCSYDGSKNLWQFTYDITLTASWTPINYQVVIAGFEDSSTVEKFPCDYDTPTPVSTSAITKPGHKLVGFSRTENATVPDDDLRCSNNTVTFYNLTDEAKQVTLYPVWEEAKDPSIKLGGYECSVDTGAVLKDSSAANSESNPYIILASYSDPTNDIEDVAYGTTFDYEFTPPEGAVTISGSKGKITYGDIDYINIPIKSTNTEEIYLYAAVLAETGIYKVSVGGVETYYQAVFSNSIQATSIGNDSTYSIGASISGTNSDGSDYCPANLGEDYNEIFSMDGKLEVVDGNYVKNYTVKIPSSIKAKSKINVVLRDFDDGYSIGTENNSFDVTLDENGNASKIVKVSSTWDGKDNVEYIKFNFVLKGNLDADFYENFNFEKNSTSIGSDSYTSKYVAEDNKYVKVYTIREALNDGDTVKAYYGSYNYFDFIDGDTKSNELAFTGNTSNTVIISDNDINQYIKVVFNPEYTLKFYEDLNKETVLAEMPETVGGKYTLPENPTKAGYKFAGWYVGNDIQLYDGMEVAQAHGTEAYAKWTPITYTVKIDANGGTAKTSTVATGWSIADYEKSVQKTDVKYDTSDKIGNITVVGGVEDLGTDSASALVSRDGYDLLGFSTDKNATVPDENLSFLDEDGNLTNKKKTINLDKLTTEDGATVTLYAVWRAESGEITLDPSRILNDISYLKSEFVVLENNKIKYTIGSKVGELPVPELKGHTFEGWYYKLNPTDEWTKLTADMTFTKELVQAMNTAGGIVTKFTENEYTINYDDCGTDNNTSAVKFVIDAFSGKPRVLNSDGKYIDYETLIAEPEKEGYKFVGYTINGIVKNDFAETKAYFTPDDIKNFFAGDELTYNTSATKSEKFVIGAEDVTIKGIWKVDETKSIINVDYDNAVISYKNAKGTTITVKPTSSSYKNFPSSIVGTPGERIAYDCVIDGNDGLDNITFTDYGFDVDDTECTLSKDGYMFKGWFTKDADGNEVAFTSTTFTAGLTEIYAKWEAESNLTIPENVAVSADGTVTWTGGEGAAYFRVYKVYNGITKNAKTTSSPYTFQNLTEGVEHEIYVVAYDGNGNSLKSESIKFTPVSAPANVKVAEDGTVSWTGGEGAAYFRVYKVYNGITKNAKTESSPYTFQNLTEGVEHEIYVVAFDSQGNQYKSDSVKFTPEKKAVLTAPTNVKVDADGKVTWKAAENAAYYKVSKVVNGKTSTGKQVTGTEYTFQYLAKGQKHEIYVTAFDKDGNSLKSESITVTPMAAPANVKVAEDGTVTWTKSEGAAYYRVYKKYGKTTKNAKVDATATSYTFQNLTEGVEHEIYVIAFDANGNQYKSESVMFTPAKKATLTAPTNIKVDADGNVTWTAAENAAYYKVSKVVAGKTYTGKQTTDTKYTFVSFNPGQNKTVYVTAFDKDGNSIKSASVIVKAVENITVTATGTVTFDKVDGASYYKVFKEYNGITKNAKTTASPYTFQTFTKGVKHDVYVKAYNASGKEIAVSKTVTVTAK